MDNLGDQYKILFETMMETCETKQIQRRVIRHADFHLPEYWDVQMDNVKRFSVKIDSDEFRGIHALFDKTMAGMYMTIIRIERIQNKPWYMQYNSYKSFSSKKDTERKLFHGCPQQSADLIIHSFFNRSFAGINGNFINSINTFVKKRLFYSRCCLRARCVFLSQCQLQSWVCKSKY